MSQACVELDGVSIRFGPVRALEAVSFAVPAGLVAGVVGPDGAGKTTLLRACMGLLRACEGSVRVLGHELPRDVRLLKTSLGYLPQKLSVLAHLTVRENLEYFGALYGVETGALRERIEALLRVTELAPFQQRQAQHLSGGMRQKLALSCALLHRPGLMLLDEPWTGLDPLSRRDLWELIYALLDEEGAGGPGSEGPPRSVLVATPSWEEAARCQWLLVLDGGQVAWTGDPARLTEQAAGLVWELEAAPGAHEALTALPWVLSVGRRGGQVRVVLDREALQADRPAPGAPAEALREAVPPSAPHQVAPTLEDALVLITKAGQEDPGADGAIPP